MSKVLRMGRQAFTVGVVGATIAWSIGLAGLLQPLTARATVTTGSLIKGSLPAVYYYGADGKRYVFPNVKTFNTWYADFSSVQTVTDAEIAAIPIGGNVTYRAGTRLVKIQTDPKVYAVEPNGVIRWVETAAVAEALYGASWATKVDDVADVFFTDYTAGTSVATAATYPKGSLVKNPGFASIYYVDGASKRYVDTAGMSANRFMNSFVVETSQNLSVYTDGANITAYEGGLAAPAGGAATTPTVSGTVSVTLASDTPAGATLPQGANAVPLLSLNLTSSAATTVSSIIVKRFGVGSNSDFSNVYLYHDGTRLTDGRTVNNSTNEVTFTGLNIALTAGSSYKVTVRADVGTSLTSGGSHGFQLESAAKVTAGGATVGGTFPISGNVFTIGAATTGTVTIDKTGSITNPTLGQQNAEIGRFTVAASTETATITQINLDLQGTIRNTDLSALSLWQGTTKVSEVASVTSTGKMNFALSPAFVLAEGTTRTFNVKATVAGDASRTVGVRLEEKGDLLATGSRYGFGMQVTNSGYNGGTGDDTAKGTCAATTDDCSFSTVQGGSVTFAFNGPSSGNVAANSQDQVLMNFSITAQQFVTIKDLDIILDCTSAGDCDADTDDNGGLYNDGDNEGNLKDIKIVKDDGTLLMGPLEIGTTAAEDLQDTMDFTDDFTMNAGQTLNLRVTADIDNNATAGSIFRAKLDVSGLNIEDVNGDTLATANIVPSADMVGNSFTVRASSLTVALTTPPSDGASQTTIKGTNNKDSVAFSFTAGNASAITVSALTLTAYVDDDPGTDVNDFMVGTDTEPAIDLAVTDIISSASIYDGDTGTLIAGPEAVVSSSTGAINFDSFTWTVPAGATKKLLAKVNIANYSISGTDAYALRIATIASDVTAQDGDGNTVTAAASGNLNGTYVDPDATPTVFVVLAGAGTLAVTRDSSSPRSEIVLAGATDVTVSKFRFDATNEAFKVTKLTIAEGNATDQGGSAGDYDNNISSVKVSYAKQDGTTATATGFLTAGSSTIALASGSEFYVPANSNRVLTVMMSLPTTDNGATTGEKPRLDFMSTAAADFEAVGVSSGSTLVGTDVGDAEAYTMVVRKTAPTISLASGSPSGAGVPGLSEVFRFTVAAAAGESVVLNKLAFKITSTDNNGDTGGAGATGDWNTCESGGIETSDFSLYNSADLSTQLEASNSDWSLLDATGAACSTATVGFARLSLTNPEVVSAGTTRTYILKVDTTGASSANDDSFRVDITSEPLLSVTSFLSGSVYDAVPAVTATSIDVTAPGNFSVGDLVCLSTTAGACASGAEVALVTAIGGSAITVYRGDLGTTPTTTDITIGDHVRRMPASVVWNDTGSTASTAYISGYLVKNLDVTGGTIVY